MPNKSAGQSDEDETKGFETNYEQKPWLTCSTPGLLPRYWYFSSWKILFLIRKSTFLRKNLFYLVQGTQESSHWEWEKTKKHWFLFFFFFLSIFTSLNSVLFFLLQKTSFSSNLSLHWFKKKANFGTVWNG